MHVSAHARDIIDGSRVFWVVTLSSNFLCSVTQPPRRSLLLETIYQLSIWPHSSEDSWQLYLQAKICTSSLLLLRQCLSTLCSTNLLLFLPILGLTFSYVVSKVIKVPYEAELHQFDVAIDAKPSGRIVFKMFDDVVPQTTRNFRELATGQHGFGFAGSRFHRIIPGVSISLYLSV